jgi:hypothetical protein
MQAALRSPVVIDEPALGGLARAGYRWLEGQAGPVRYRWLLPGDWVLAATLPPGRPGAHGTLERLRGVGDPSGRFTAVLGMLRACAEAPHQLVKRGAGPDAQYALYSSRVGPVAERVERRDAQTLVTVAHAFNTGGEQYRFCIAALGPAAEADSLGMLRLLGSALSLSADPGLTANRPLRLPG